MQCKNQKQRQFAAYGRTLAQRQLFKNRPLLVIICTGGDSWTRVKKWQQHTNFAALVLTPEQRQAALKWPVSRYPVLVEWYTGQDENLIIEMVKCLHKAGAFFITVAPLFVDYSTPSKNFDRATQDWVQTREIIRTYFPKKVRHVAR